MNHSCKVNKILITNIVTLNTGDAAILFGTIKMLKKIYGPDIDVVVFDKSAEIAQRHYSWADFRQALFPVPKKGLLYRITKKLGYSHWLERIRFYRFYISIYLIKSKLKLLARFMVSGDEEKSLMEYIKADLIVSTGGTYLIENYNLIPAIYDYRISLLCGAKLGFFTQSLGPFNNTRTREDFINIFNSASFILLRDERSKKNIMDLGVSESKIYIAADAAFVLAKRDLDAALQTAQNISVPTKVAISVRNIENFYPKKSGLYVAAIIEVVRMLVEDYQVQVTFLSTCQGIKEYWNRDDEYAEEIYALLPENIKSKVVVDHIFRQPMDVVEKYQTFDAVIATRMHAAILSFCAGVPTMGFAYEFKMEELFNTMRLADLVVNIDSILLEDVASCVSRLLMENRKYKEKVSNQVSKMYADAWSAIGVLPEVDKCD